MLSFCLRVLNMSHDFIINYSIFGKVSSPSRRKRSTVVSSKTLRAFRSTCRSLPERPVSTAPVRAGEQTRESPTEGSRRTYDRTRLGSAIPRLLHIEQMSSPDGIDNGSPRIKFPHAHKKAFDEVHLGGGEMAQQASRTFRWVFGDGLKGRKPGDRGRRTWKSLPDLS